MSGIFVVEPVTITPGTFTRATTGTYIDSAGVRQTAAIDVLRANFDPATLAYDGILWEPARTNLVLNSAVLVTQVVAVAAVPHTLSFYGTGTVTLSGAHAAVVVGTGAFPTKTELTFTPTAGNVTLTVTGSVTEAQLEAGSESTSYIPTVGSQVTRAADVLTGGMCSTIPETDYPQWNAATAYTAVTSRVIRTTTGTHKIYQRVISGTTATPPESDTTNWAEVSPTNVWKVFDGVNSSVTAQANQFSYVLKPGEVVSSVNGLNLSGCTTVRVRGIDPTEGVVFDQRITMTGVITESTWYSYFFSNAIEASSFEATMLDLPPYPSMDIVVDFTGDADLSCGVLLAGIATEVGEGVEHGVRSSIIDYSRKESDDFGSTVFVERAYAKRADLTFMLNNDEINAVYGLFARLRATPFLLICYSDYDPLTIFGFYKEFEIVIAYPTMSQCSLSFEGLT